MCQDWQYPYMLTHHRTQYLFVDVGAKCQHDADGQTQEAPLSEPDTVRIMARIPVEVGIKLANIAQEQDRSLSSIIRLALREWCERHAENDHPAD
jgi:hypothetical protein